MGFKCNIVYVSLENIDYQGVLTHCIHEIIKREKNFVVVSDNCKSLPTNCFMRCKISVQYGTKMNIILQIDESFYNCVSFLP